jgi:hypothetical protein
VGSTPFQDADQTAFSFVQSVPTIEPTAGAEKDERKERAGAQTLATFPGRVKAGTLLASSVPQQHTLAVLVSIACKRVVYGKRKSSGRQQGCAHNLSNSGTRDKRSQHPPAEGELHPEMSMSYLDLDRGGVLPCLLR